MKDNLSEQIRIEIGKIILADGSSGIVLETALDLIIARLADGASIDLAQDDGTIARALTRHRNLRKQVVLEAHRQENPLSITASYGYPRVIKTGKPQYIPGVTARINDRLYPERNVESMMGEMIIRSFICVPLVAQGRILGALSVERTDRNRSFSREDFLLLEEIAILIAWAMDSPDTFHLAPSFKV